MSSAANRVNLCPHPLYSPNENEVLVGFIPPKYTSDGDMEPNEPETDWYRINIGDKEFSSQIIQRGEEKVTDGQVFKYPDFKVKKRYHCIKDKGQNDSFIYYSGFFLYQMIKFKFKGVEGHRLFVGETAIIDFDTGRVVAVPYYWNPKFPNCGIANI